MSQLVPSTVDVDLDDLVLAADTTTNAYRMIGSLPNEHAAPGVQKRLAEAVSHLLNAGYILAWGTGLRSHVLGAIYTKVFWRRRRHAWAHHRDKGYSAVAELALVHTSKLKRQADTAIRNRVEPSGRLALATTDITRAWLCLGQVSYALETGTDLTSQSTISRDADEVAVTLDWITAIVDGLTPLATTMARFIGTRGLAPAAGLVTLAHQHLIDTLDTLDPKSSPRSRLDVGASGPELSTTAKPDGPEQITELCGLLDALSQETRLVADHINATGWHRDIAVTLTRTATYLAAAGKRFHHQTAGS